MKNVVAGGLYSVEWEDWFRVVKVLAVDGDVVHLRIYRNKFETRPADVEISVLTWDIDMNDLSSVGIGHLPVALEGFLEDAPVFIKTDAVTPEEIEPVNNWRYEPEDIWNESDEAT